VSIPDMTPHLITSIANFEFTIIEHDSIGLGLFNSVQG